LEPETLESLSRAHKDSDHSLVSKKKLEPKMVRWVGVNGPVISAKNS